MSVVNNSRGFTLVELLIAMVILGVVLTGVVRMFSATGHHHAAQEMMVDLAQDLRAVKQLMVYELRTAGCDPLLKRTFGFQVDANDRYDTDDNSFHFTADTDNGDGDGLLEPDGDANDPREDISYYRTNDDCEGAVGGVMASGTTTPGCLRRDVGAGGQPLMAGVTGFRLRYYDINGTELTGADLATLGKLEKIDTVRVIINAQVEEPTKVSADAQEQQLDFRVLIRNG
nr:type II secretion system protein [Desulfobulbus rhabdoformis]